METGLDRPERDPHRDGHVVERHPEEVVEHDDRSELGFELPERVVDELPFGELGRRIAHEGHVDGRELDLDGSTAATSRHVETSVHGEAVQPWHEPVRVAQTRQVPPRSHHRILDGVSRELAVPEDQPSCRVQPRDGRAGELSEGVLVAFLRAPDEVSLVHGRSAGGGPFVPLGR